MDKSYFESKEWWSVMELSESPNFPFREKKIRNLIRSGDLEAHKFSYRKVMIHRDSIAKFFEENSPRGKALAEKYRSELP